MTHPLVLQLRFTRSEFRRGLAGLSDEEAAKRLLPMNCIAWNVGHLAWHEQRYFLNYAQGRVLIPELDTQFAYGAPASEPRLAEMLAAWQKVTAAVDPWLEEQKPLTLTGRVVRHGKETTYLWGTLLQRVIYHYWYHTGENMAIRQMLGQGELPEFVGDLDGLAPYRQEG